MPVLIDTNILLRTLQPHHPHSGIAERAITSLRGRDETLLITTQNLIEFWAVASRPAAENGLGLTTEAVHKEVQAIQHFFSLLPETVPVFNTWEKLVTAYKVIGKNVHDARLVASMKVHRISKILTFNVQDFMRYAEIEPLHPESV